MSDEESMVPAPRPCAFYQAKLVPITRTLIPLSATEQTTESALKHHCMLNPGKSSGPDGLEISLGGCTLARQKQCYAQRRQAFARLYATVPQLRSA